MKLLVALEQRFRKSPKGGYYADGVFNYAFFSRYLNVFDEVLVFARVCHSVGVETESYRAEGPQVRFIEVPYFVGPLEFLRKYQQIKAVAASAVAQSDAFLLRVPGMMGSLIYKQLRKRNIPYGVEVVGDPWDSLASGSVKSTVRPFVRLLARYGLYRQCRYAAVASYVTEYSLQRRYPPGGWSTSYSSIELHPEAVIGAPEIASRLTVIDQKSRNDMTWRLCYAGTLAQLYKAPDVLIAAVAECIRRGLKLELVMLGDGQFRPSLQLQVQNLGIANNVSFLGIVSSGKSVYEQLDRSDLYVLPSRQEGLPRSVIEAMARGLPCIGTTVGGFMELLPAEYLVRPGDTQALSAKITLMLCDAEKMKQAVLRNVAISSNYTSGRLKQKRMELYTRLRNLSGQKSKS